ncbi:MAG: hypothetical protein QXV17_10475 [Candidatus Micrarchaeaceae archaeon]
MAVKHRSVKNSGDVLYASEWNDRHDAPLEALDNVQIANPQNGQVLTYNASLAKWINQAPPPSGGGAGLTLIQEVVASSNVQNLDVSNLDLNLHKLYKIFISLKYAAASDYVYLYVNNDEVNANYETQGLTGNGTTVSAYRDPGPIVGYGSVDTYDEDVIEYIMMRTPSGYVLWGGVRCYMRPNTFIILNHNVIRTKVAHSNVNSLRMKHASTTGIGAGSRILVFGYVSG